VDAIWASTEPLEAMLEAGDPPTRAPEIGVEVLSASNTEEEMRERCRLVEAGDEDVWIVDEAGEVRFFGTDPPERSDRAPGCPERRDGERSHRARTPGRREHPRPLL